MLQLYFMSGVITLHEVLAVIDSGQPFPELIFIQANRRKGTGGKIDTIRWGEKADYASLPDNILKANKIPESQKRDPKHWENKTRNIYLPKTRGIKKVHIKLITGFGGKTVLL